ncbi:MAG: DUF2341 domain-containing protein [Candidatus Heimdallarchaeota archaeon]
MNVLLKNKRKYLVSLVILIFVSFFLFSATTQRNNVVGKASNNITFSPISVNWWNASWTYSRQVEINNPNYLLTDYAVKVIIPFYFDYGNASDDGADIRFTSQDNSTLLNYWIEEWDNTSDSTVWVKISTLAADSVHTIFLYYGNPLADYVSNGTLVFDAFDDFSGTTLNENLWNVTTWDEGGSRSYDVSNGELHVNITSPGNDLLSGYQFTSKESFSYANFSLIVKARWITLDYTSGYGLFCSPIIIDNTNESNYLGLALGGAENVIVKYELDTINDYEDVPDDSLGDAQFDYKGIDNIDFDFDLSGRYGIGLGAYGSSIEMPYTLGLESLIKGINELDVSVQVYYDLICYRKYAVEEPSSKIIIEDAPDLYYPTINLISPTESGTYPPNQTISIFIWDDLDGAIEISYRWDAQFFVTFYIESNTIIEFYLPFDVGFHLLTIYATDEADHFKINSFSFYTGEVVTSPTNSTTTIISGYSIITTISIISVVTFIIYYKTKRKRK